MVVLYQVFQCLVFGGKMGIPLVADVLQALTSVDVGTGSSEKTAQSEFNHVQLEVLLGLGLLFLQTSRRLYECVAIVDYSKEAKIHVSHYLLGYIFYLLRAPLVVLHLTSYDGVNVASSTNGIMSAFKWNHLLGMGIFVYGAYHQYVCHCILADLRSNKSITATSSNSKQYSIPYGDWFKYTSSPHYFAEIVLYVGVCLTLWGFTPAWLIPLFTVSCLSFSAYWTHRWYLKEFPEYKKLNRTSIIPYVW
jgi:3-oxo-5-alpha-steroid 4-dehydrogenase 3